MTDTQLKSPRAAEVDAALNVLFEDAVKFHLWADEDFFYKLAPVAKSDIRTMVERMLAAAAAARVGESQ